MKIRKEEFKAMLKECILELAQEGKIFQSARLPVRESMGEEGELEGTRTPNDRLNEAIKLTTQLVSKGDPKQAALYQRIIEDTAKTTLQKQLAGELTGGAMTDMPATSEEIALDKAQLNVFAASKRWAQVALSKTKS